jgi:hypothetical protein
MSHRPTDAAAEREVLSLCRQGPNAVERAAILPEVVAPRERWAKLAKRTLDGRRSPNRPAPPAQELQIDIRQRHPDPDHQAAKTITRTDHAQTGNTHSEGSHRHGRPTRNSGRNDKEDHLHNMHYAEHLEDLACAAALVRDPISGKIIGVVNLTCWRKNADALLIALAQSTADQITQALLDDTSGGQVQLLQEYLRACRHTGGIVFALNSDMVMMSHHARDVLDPGDQAALLGHAAEALAGDHHGLVEVGLPSGARARMSCRPVRGKGQRGRAGGVAHVKLIKLNAAAEAHPRGSGPGLVGSRPLWLRGCDQVDAAYCGGEWLALEGEPGVGKLALLQAVHRRRNPAGALHMLDATEAADHHWLVRALSELLEGQGSLVIRHVDRLSALRLRTLSIALEQALAAGRQKVLWVAITPSWSARPRRCSCYSGRAGRGTLSSSGRYSSRSYTTSAAAPSIQVTCRRSAGR